MGEAKSAFALIELIIIVAIIGSLIVIGVPNFVCFVDVVREASTKADLVALREAILAYYNDTEGIFPYSISSTYFKIKVGGKERFFSFLPSKFHPGYFPADPSYPNCPKAWARLKKSAKNNFSNRFDFVGDPLKEPDNKRATYLVEEKGGWLYTADRDGGILYSKNGPTVYTCWGDITVNHSSLDSTNAVWYYQY